MSSFKNTNFYAVSQKLRGLLEDVEAEFDIEKEEGELTGLEAEIAAVVEKLSDEEKECVTKALEILKKYSDEVPVEDEPVGDEEPVDVDEPETEGDVEGESREVDSDETLEERRRKAKKAKKEKEDKEDKKDKDDKKKK
jgi:hypothetical protein